MNQSPSRQPSKQASVYGESEKAILGKVVLNLEPEFQFPNDAREALLFQVRNPYPPNAVPARSLEEEDYVEAVSALIERDFFPDLPHLRARHELMQARLRGDNALARALEKKLLEMPRPTPKGTPHMVQVTPAPSAAEGGGETLRARRSVARRHYRSGTVVPWKLRQVLLSHHATSHLQRRRLQEMGRGRGANRPFKAEVGNGFNVWRGAWSPAQQAPWQQGPQRQQQGSIPGYMSVQLEADTTSLGSQGRSLVPVEDGDSSLVPTVQSALNQTRKAEGKVLKLRRSLVERSAKFKEWEAKMMASYQRERLKFAKDTERLQREVAEAEQEQTEARAALRAMAYSDMGGSRDKERDVDMPPVENVFAAWASAEERGNMDVLQRALAADVTPTRSAPAIPRTPPAAADPYLMAGTPVAPPGLPAPGTFLQAPVPPHSAPTEAPALRGVPLEYPADPNANYGPSPTLQDKLKRRRAMEPFGGGVASKAAGSGPDLATLTLAEAQAALARGRRIRIVEDDGDEEVDVEEELEHADAVASENPA
ncbi:Gm166 [Symbiodinium sp. KB8]|nr:Gm166 [Symbiodinium sp. KB8]